MKDFLFHKDKGTRKDELYLSLFIVACIVAGILFFVFAPTNWIIQQIQRH